MPFYITFPFLSSSYIILILTYFVTFCFMTCAVYVNIDCIANCIVVVAVVQEIE